MESRTSRRTGRGYARDCGAVGSRSRAASAVTDAPVDVATRDLPDVAAPKVGDPISDAEMRDLETVAEQSGASLDEVIERYAWNDSFALAGPSWLSGS